MALYSYDNYERALAEVDAVDLAQPNHLHVNDANSSIALCAVLCISQVTLESQRWFCYKSLGLCLANGAGTPSRVEATQFWISRNNGMSTAQSGAHGAPL